jgi:hypothetical protein
MRQTWDRGHGKVVIPSAICGRVRRVRTVLKAGQVPAIRVRVMGCERGSHSSQAIDPVTIPAGLVGHWTGSE